MVDYHLTQKEIPPLVLTSTPTGMGLAGVTGLCPSSGGSPRLAHAFQQSPRPGKAFCEGGW